MNIIVKNVFVQTHHFIDQIKQYYKSIKQIYNIIITKNWNIKFNLIL